MNDASQLDDLKSLLCGEFLGEGVHRKVYVYRPDETLVIKCAIEDPTGNIIESEIWDMVKETSIARWFAPVEAISRCGMYMLQKRVEHRPKEEYPKLVPHFFGDRKYSNYGWLNGKLVACDYVGFFVASMSHKWSAKMEKAGWW